MKKDEGIAVIATVSIVFLLISALVLFILNTVAAPNLARKQAVSRTLQKMKVTARAVKDYYKRPPASGYPIYSFVLPANLSVLTGVPLTDEWHHPFAYYTYYPCDTNVFRSHCPVPVKTSVCSPDDPLSYPQFVIVSPGPNGQFEYTSAYVRRFTAANRRLPERPPAGSDDLVVFSTVKDVVDEAVKEYQRRRLTPLVRVIADYWSLRYKTCCLGYGEVVGGAEGWHACPRSFTLPYDCKFATSGGLRTQWRDLFNPDSCVAYHPLCAYSGMASYVNSVVGVVKWQYDMAGNKIRFEGAVGPVTYRLRIPCFTGRDVVYDVVVPSNAYEYTARH